MHVLFRTVHGSRLYGMSHDQSDWDWYTVVDKVKTKKAKYSTHTIVDDRDSVVVDFGTWVESCKRGVPQALEAMFSQQAEVDEIADFRAGFRVGTQAWDRYLRTIKSFAYTDKEHYNEYKRKRHSLRLAYSFKHIREDGRFNPTLDPASVESMSRIAHFSSDTVYRVAKKVAWS